VSKYKVVKLVCDKHGIFDSKELVIDGKNMIVEGKTGSGKTTLVSLLQKIIHKNPNIKNGEKREKLEAFLEGKCGEKIYLKRTNTVKDSTPIYVNEEGVKLTDKEVKNMLFALSQDPLGLMRKRGIERYEFLLKCSDVDITTMNNLKFQRVKVADQRKDCKKHLDYLSSQVGEQPQKTKRVDIAMKQNELDGVISHNDTIKEYEASNTTYYNYIASCEERINSLTTEISRYKTDIKEYKGKIKKNTDYLEENKKIDISETQIELSVAIKNNESVLVWEKWYERHKEYENENNGFVELDEEVKDLDSQIKNLTSTIKFPIDGVTIDGSEIYFNGVDYDKLGTSEQILISASLVAQHIVKQKNIISLMVIDRGESMDLETQKNVIKVCNKLGVQVFVSIVDRKETKGTFDVDYLEFEKIEA